MNIATHQLRGTALHWAYLKAIGYIDDKKEFEIRDGKIYMPSGSIYEPSTNWLQGGPILDSFDFVIRKRSKQEEAQLENSNPNLHVKVELFGLDSYGCGFGPNILTAALRCVIDSRLGRSVDIPAACLNTNSPLYREGPTP